MLAALMLPTALVLPSVPNYPLPGTADKLPAIGYGTWLSAPGEVYQATKTAINE